MMKRLIKILISAGLIWWVLSRVELARVWEATRGADPRLIGLGVLLGLFSYWVSAERWRVLLAAQGVRATWLELVKSCLVGAFFNQFLPSSVGGDVVRAMDLRGRLGSLTRSLAILVFDRLLGIVALYLFACLGVLFGLPGLEGNLGWSLAGFAVLAVGLAWLVGAGGRWLKGWDKGRGLPLAGKLIAKALDVRETLLFHLRDPGPTARVFGLAVLNQLNIILVYYLIGLAFGLKIGLGPLIIIVPVVMILTFLPISINGIGVREGAFVYLLAQLQVTPEKSLAIAWIIYLASLFYSLIGGLIYAVRTPEAKVGRRAGEGSGSGGEG